MPPHVRVVADDFQQVLSFLQEQGIVPNPAPVGLVPLAREIHKRTYSLILWKFRLTRIPKHGKVFIEEIASDALQILPQVLMGYVKTTKLLNRGIIENTLRHVFFSDHPVEFLKMNRENKWFMHIEELIRYTKSHPILEDSELRFNALARINDLYGNLSAGIHGRRVRDLEMRTALNRISYNDTTAQSLSALVKQTAEAVNFVLATFHRDKVERFQTEDRRIILQTMSRQARRAWNQPG